MNLRPARFPVWWAASAVVAAGVAAYANSFSGPFVLDDLPSIPDNPTIRHLWPVAPLLHPPGLGATVDARPLLNVSFALNYAISGTEVWSYHLVNLLIHLVASLALFGTVRRTAERLAGSGAALRAGDAPGRSEGLGGQGWPTAFALAVALIWELHPLQTESVTYIVQRAESQTGLCYLVTLYAFIRAEAVPAPAASAWRLVSWLACLIGMGTKEVMVSAPVIVLAYDALFVSGGWAAALRRRPAWYFALAATWIPLAALALRAGDRGRTILPGMGARAVNYWLAQPGAIARYLRLSFWPQGQVFFFDGAGVPPVRAVLLPAILVLGLLAVTAYGLTQARRAVWAPVGFLGLWFFATLAPTCLVPESVQTLAEHWMYLALAAVITAALWALVAALGWLRGDRASAVTVLGIGLALPCAWATHLRNLDYSTAERLYARDLAVQPENPYAHANLGFAEAQSGRLAEAARQLEEALRLRPGWPIPEFNLGRVEEQLGHPVAAEQHLRAAIRGQPDGVTFRLGLFEFLVRRGRREEGMRELEPWLRANPARAPALDAAARDWGSANRWAEAAALAEVLVRVFPGQPGLRNNWGIALTRVGRVPEAIACYREAVRLEPRNAEAHYNLAQALAKAGRLEEAVAEFRAAIEWHPDFPAAECYLGDALRDLGREPEAWVHYEAAARLDPHFAEARDRLRRVRAGAEP